MLQVPDFSGICLDGMVNSVGKGCSKIDWAYIAGLFDCDGAIMATIEPHREKRFGFRVRVILKLTQKRPDILVWIQNAVCVGRIVRNRTTYDWIVKSQSDCYGLLRGISPYIRGKNKQVAYAVKILDSTVSSRKDLLYIARLADTLSGFNVRSSGRRTNYASMIKEHSSSND